MRKITNDLITDREIFPDIENEYFCAHHRHPRRKRTKDINQPGGANDLASYNRQYGSFFARFPDEDK